MIVRCEKCGTNYDDASRWTVCPHNSLDVSPVAVYCRRCDLYVGLNNLKVPTFDKERCMGCGRTAEEIRREA